MLAGRFEDAVAALKQILERNDEQVTTRQYLFAAEMFRSVAYEKEGRLDEAELVLTTLLDRGAGGSRLHGRLGRLAKKQGREEEAERYWQTTIEENMAARFLTRRTYSAIKAELDRRGILLEAVQYPLRPLAALKDVLADHRGVLFVDSERAFKDVLEREPYEKYFKDRFAGDFGHFTPAGARVLAREVARVILRDAGDAAASPAVLGEMGWRPVNDTLILECAGGARTARLDALLVYGDQQPPPRHETRGFESTDRAASKGYSLAIEITLPGRASSAGAGYGAGDYDQIRMTGVTRDRVGVRFGDTRGERVRLVGPTGATLATDGTGIELDDVTTTGVLPRLASQRHAACRLYRVQGPGESHASTISR